MFDEFSGKLIKRKGLSNEDIKSKVKDYLIETIQKGGALSDVATGEGDLPTFAEVMDWEITDADFKAKLINATEVRNAYIKDCYSKRLIEYLKSPTKSLKEEIIQLEKSITHLQKYNQR